MERIAGNPISSAQWALQEPEDGLAWERASTVIKECLGVDEWKIHEESNKLVWIADSLTVSAEYRPTSPLPQFRITIEVLADFNDDDDGWFLASNLNHKAVGGAYVYRPKTKSLDFVLYCAASLWFDFAFLLLGARTAIGHCENLSRRDDILRFAKCRSAARPHPIRGQRTEHHELFLDRFWDVTQMDFIGGLWLSDREREGVFERIHNECPSLEIQPGWAEGFAARTIETMDFGYQISIDSAHRSVLRDYTAFSLTEFNCWTDFGRSIVIHVSLPLFTWEGIFDDGASHDEAVRLANLLNLAANEMCWQKLGIGAWFAKGSQICFSMAIPHANLKPVVIGAPRYEIADIIFDVVNPNMVHRLVNIAVRDLHQIDVISQREPQEMDSINSVARLRRIDSPVRARNESVHARDIQDSLWDLPSFPLLVYGVFNPVGPSLGSIELISGRESTIIVNRYRHHMNPGEVVLCELPENVMGLPSAIRESVGRLHEHTSIPDFIHVSVDLDSEIKDAVFDGLLDMCKGFADEDVDLTLKAMRIQHQPNPWWRPMDPDSEETPEISELNGLTPAEAYLSTAMQTELVDYNLGLFQAWWEGALAFLRDPNSPDEATRTVERFTEHTLDRMRGPQVN